MTDHVEQRSVQAYDGPERRVRRQGIHVWRWRALALWIALVTAAGTWTLLSVRDQSRQNDKRFCDVTSSFITSSLELRSAQTRAGIRAIGERRSLAEATKTMTSILLSRPLPLPPTQHRFQAALRNYLRAETSLNINQIKDVVTTVVAGNKASDEWHDLRRRLKCS
jgi:hypothetical protein